MRKELWQRKLASLSHRWSINIASTLIFLWKLIIWCKINTVYCILLVSRCQTGSRTDDKGTGHPGLEGNCLNVINLSTEMMWSDNDEASKNEEAFRWKDSGFVQARFRISPTLPCVPHYLNTIGKLSLFQHLVPAHKFSSPFKNKRAKLSWCDSFRLLRENFFKSLPNSARL